MRVYLRETINGTDDVAHKRAIEGCGGGPDTPTRHSSRRALSLNRQGIYRRAPARSEWEGSGSEVSQASAEHTLDERPKRGVADLPEA